MTPTIPQERNPVLRAAADRTGQFGQALVFRMPGAALQRFAIGVSAKQLMGVQPAEAFPPWPSAPPRWLGVTQWNGKQAPVIDLAACFNLGSSDYRSARRLVFLRSPKRGVILATPAMGDVAQVEHTAGVFPAEGHLHLTRDYIRGVFTYGSELLIVPDLDAIWDKVLHPAASAVRSA
jgi:chemotaxis signal transduction protein